MAFLYGYVSGGPLNWNDPWGLWEVCGKDVVWPWDPEAAGFWDSLQMWGTIADRATGQAGQIITMGETSDWEVVSGLSYVTSANDGYQTGRKAQTNAILDTAVGLVTLGSQSGKDWGLHLEPTRTDKIYGYDHSYMFSRGGAELGGGLLTGGASHLSKVGKVVTVWDAAGNAVGFARGAANAYDQGGLTWQNSAEMIGGALGGCGCVSTFRRLPEFPSTRQRFLTADDLTSLPQSGTIDPKLIRFSQDSISSNFRNGGSIQELVSQLRSGKVDALTIPPIRIVAKGEGVFSLDNRRLKAFQEAGIGISFEKLDSIPRKELRKFSTTNEGVDIIIRGKQ